MGLVPCGAVMEGRRDVDDRWAMGGAEVGECGTRHDKGADGVDFHDGFKAVGGHFFCNCEEIASSAIDEDVERLKLLDACGNGCCAVFRFADVTLVVCGGWWWLSACTQQMRVITNYLCIGCSYTPVAHHAATLFQYLLTSAQNKDGCTMQTW